MNGNMHYRGEQMKRLTISGTCFSCLYSFGRRIQCLLHGRFKWHPSHIFTNNIKFSRTLHIIRICCAPNCHQTSPNTILLTGIILHLEISRLPNRRTQNLHTDTVKAKTKKKIRGDFQKFMWDFIRLHPIDIR